VRKSCKSAAGLVVRASASAQRSSAKLGSSFRRTSTTSPFAFRRTSTTSPRERVPTSRGSRSSTHQQTDACANETPSLIRSAARGQSGFFDDDETLSEVDDDDDDDDSRSSTKSSFAVAEGSLTLSSMQQTARYEQVDARDALQKRSKNRKQLKQLTDESYLSTVAIRAQPISTFLGRIAPLALLPITSMNEDRCLKELGIPKDERDRIEGLQVGLDFSDSVRLIGRAAPNTSSWRRRSLTEQQLSSRTLARFAADPLPEVGAMQRRTTTKMWRPFPLGLRFSSKNMNPLPFWLAGAQHVAINLCTNDLPSMLHHALFKGSPYLLKPPEMRDATQLGYKPSLEPELDSREPPDVQGALSTPSTPGGEKASKVGLPPASTKGRGSFVQTQGRIDNEDAFWPPLRDNLDRVSIDILTLHGLPKRGEQRPRLDGRRGACHQYHPELSGIPAPPDDSPPSSPHLRFTIQGIGGFCTISDTLPLRSRAETEIATVAADQNGLQANVGQQIHCVAAEPHTTFLHVSVSNGGQAEVAYEIVVLGRLRHGYRVLSLRNLLGTRIELAYLLIRVNFGTEQNLWSTSRHLRMIRRRDREEAEERRAQQQEDVADSFAVLERQLSTAREEAALLRGVMRGSAEVK